MNIIGQVAGIQNIGQANGINTNNSIKTNSDFIKIFEDALKMAAEADKVGKESGTALLDMTVEDLHSVIIDAEKAQLTLGLAVQVRNRVIDAYNEIMRMQI
ncbi:MAG: flagellar hook-basal body complex protein FliE [Clostridiaceae bacterium]|nr:flagellar hook-basal body complex protein FliE [Clostridiaceae bacterium]